MTVLLEELEIAYQLIVDEGDFTGTLHIANQMGELVPEVPLETRLQFAAEKQYPGHGGKVVSL